jgi:hypothetical protein
MRPYLITAKLMRPSNMKRFPTPGLVSIMSEYGLDDRVIEVRSPAEAKGLFL